MLRRGPGLVRTAARTAAIAGTATAVSGRVHHRQQEKWAAENEQQYQEAPPPPPPPAPIATPAAPDPMAEIQQLAQLHEQGILTDEEFSAKKAQLLGI